MGPKSCCRLQIPTCGKRLCNSVVVMFLENGERRGVDENVCQPSGSGSNRLRGSATFLAARGACL